jgi:hypothetical protein
MSAGSTHMLDSLGHDLRMSQGVYKTQAGRPLLGLMTLSHGVYRMREDALATYAGAGGL